MPFAVASRTNRKRRKRFEGYVYLAITRDLRVMKIGWSTKPAQRFHALNHECRNRYQMEIRFLAIMAGSRRLERELKERFQLLRIDGNEWFCPHQDIVRAFRGRSLRMSQVHPDLCDRHGVLRCMCAFANGGSWKPEDFSWDEWKEMEAQLDAEEPRPLAQAHAVAAFGGEVA